MLFRLTLGLPTSMLMSALELAVKCVQSVLPEAGGTAHVIIEAGYVLLGALCISLPEDVLTVSAACFDLQACTRLLYTVCACCLTCL